MRNRLGSFISFNNGLLKAVEQTYQNGANTLMIYTGAPQNSIRKPIDIDDKRRGLKLMKDLDIYPLVVHAPYIINLANAQNINTLKSSIQVLSTELRRTTELGADRIVLHPGSNIGCSKSEGINMIASSLNELITDDSPIICLETMVGKGTQLGATFEELYQIIDKIKRKDKIGVCFDTCHVHEAGYSLGKEYEDIIELFDDIVGLEYIKVFHINGSLKEQGAKQDRHANLFSKENKLPMVRLMEYLFSIKEFEEVPFILETPNPERYKDEIATLSLLMEDD